MQFYYQLVEIIASRIQSEEEEPLAVLKHFYELISSTWSVPIPGSSYELNLFGYLIQIDLPTDMLENLSP